MVMTILEARVAQENWPAMEQEFARATTRLDPGLVQTFLIHSLKEPDLWRIQTVWSSREALDAMRATGETPRGVLIFRAAGAEPTLSVFTIVAQA